jgi:hypothetical protein
MDDSRLYDYRIGANIRQQSQRTMPLFLDLFASFLAVFLHMFDEEFGIYKEILCLNAFWSNCLVKFLCLPRHPV